MRQIVLDTETTGLSAAEGDRIIELGCVEMIGRKLTGRHLHLYFNPERDISEEATNIHGIRNEDLLDQPRFAQKAQDIVQYLQGAEVIIHNADFDVAFLDSELQRAGLPALTTCVADITDTLAMAKAMYPGKRNSLDALCDRLEIDRSSRSLHGALLDAQLLAQVYLHMTRSQADLLMEGEDDMRGSQEHGEQRMAAMVDLRGLALSVLSANAQELAEHDKVLEQIDKDSGGKTIWRAFSNAPQTMP